MSKKINPHLDQKLIDFLIGVNEGNPVPFSKNHKANLQNLLANYREKEQEKNDYLQLLAATSENSDKEFINQEIANLVEEQTTLIAEGKKMVLLEEGSKQNIVVEIRPGAGGTEAGLFCRDLFRMYTKFAESKKWKIEMVESKVDSLGNFTFVAFIIKGKEAFDYLRNEGGVHRVQRVPKTETKGRIHTSTASVAILPEAKEITLKINPSELKIDTYRASGAGGQHVNTTDSAVRITHLPSGVVATSQDGRSQHDNKEKALFILRSRLLEKQQQDEAKATGQLRSSMIGTSDRAEKIRTYNFPQNRITDHRIGLTLNKLNFVIEGELEEICQALTDWQVEKKITILSEKWSK